MDLTTQEIKLLQMASPLFSVGFLGLWPFQVPKDFQLPINGDEILPSYLKLKKEYESYCQSSKQNPRFRYLFASVIAIVGITLRISHGKEISPSLKTSLLSSAASLKPTLKPIQTRLSSRLKTLPAPLRKHLKDVLNELKNLSLKIQKD